MPILTLLAAHQGEEFVIILPAIMLIGAYFVLRWANQNDKQRGEDGEDEAVPDSDVLPEERPVGLVLPKLKPTDSEVASPTGT